MFERWHLMAQRALELLEQIRDLLAELRDRDRTPS